MDFSSLISGSQLDAHRSFLFVRWLFLQFWLTNVSRRMIEMVLPSLNIIRNEVLVCRVCEESLLLWANRNTGADLYLMRVYQTKWLTYRWATINWSHQIRHDVAAVVVICSLKFNFRMKKNVYGLAKRIGIISYSLSFEEFKKPTSNGMKLFRV